MNSLNQQQYLADFAPKQSLDKYAKGADPRVISGIVALSEMQQQAAMRQHAATANGAAQGQMPTVRDKIMQMFQQANQPRQQPQQQPNPMAQGIMAQARPPMQTAPMPQEAPQEVTQEAQMYHGGVARLPVSDRMFGYAGGGIIAFSGKERSDVPRIGEEVPLSPEERARLERELEMRLIGEEERARNAPAPEPTTSSPPDLAQRYQMAVEDGNASTSPTRDRSTSMAGDIGRGIMSGLRKVGSAIDATGEGITSFRDNLNRQRELNRERMAQVPGFFEALTPEQRAERQAKMRELGQQIDANQLVSTAAPAAAPTPAPTGKPQLQGPRTLVGDAAAEHARLEKARENFISGQKTVGGMTYGQAVEAARQKNGGTLTREQLEIINRRFAGAEADAGVGIKTLPGATPSRTQTQVRIPGGSTQPTQDQESRFMDLLEKQYGPQPAVESTENRLKRKDKYVKDAPTSEEALALLKHYDKMAKRYEANDQAEEAQKAINARNNLWTFLMNTRGSSLAVAAGKANAALQPLLETQETRRQTYQKQRDEQEMLMGKARYEIAQAERARKEGRYADAEKSELEAKKLQEQARGHNIQGLTSLLNAAGAREERKLGREQQYLMHRERMDELGIQRERMREEANRIKEQGERTQRENAYARQSKDKLEQIRKAQTLLTMPNLDKETKTRTETLLQRLQKEDNDMYERIVVRGDKDYRPSPTVPGGNSALTSKADKIVGIGAK